MASPALPMSTNYSDWLQDAASCMLYCSIVIRLPHLIHHRPSEGEPAMLKKILIVVSIIIAALLTYIATRPDTYQVSRSIQTTVEPARVYLVVNDFRNFPLWSPWQRLDPAMRVTYGGPPAGVGATYAWAGNKDAGKGRMTIVESIPDRKVGMDLVFIDPFAAQARTDIDIEPTGVGSKITWTMRGQHTFMSKAMSVFAPMDAMVGNDFEEGLDNLKRLVQPID